MNSTLTALAGFLAWSLFLLVLMEVIRSKLVLTKAIAANGFTPDNSNLSPFMQRLARAHANCVALLMLPRMRSWKRPWHGRWSPRYAALSNRLDLAERLFNPP